METIPGSHNWLLSVRREVDHVVLLRCATPDVSAVLPGELWGLPVTVLADHALAPLPPSSTGSPFPDRSTPLAAGSASLPVGSDSFAACSLLVRQTASLRITCGTADDTPWDNARLRDLTLPSALRRVENYALYHCHALERLRLHDSVTFWGSGILTGCTNLRTIEITEFSEELTQTGKTKLTQFSETKPTWSGAAKPTQAGESALAFFAQELNQELDITLLPPDGTPFRDSSLAPGDFSSLDSFPSQGAVTPTLRLIFPAYREVYEENSPAHHFDYVIEGAGYPYHHCFRNRQLHLPTYDGLWSRFRDSGDPCALPLAWWRLRYPAELSAEAEAAYWDYLRTHAHETAEWLLRERDTAGLSFFLEHGNHGRDLFTFSLSLARELRNTEAAALLLERQRLLSPAANRFAL